MLNGNAIATIDGYRWLEFSCHINGITMDFHDVKASFLVEMESRKVVVGSDEPNP